jgi:DtxR family Mn-dependent transcriptional regulator
MEDYVEAILALQATGPVVRAGQVAEALGVSNASVTSALQNLAGGAYVDYEPYGYVRLTPKGEEAARSVRRRHRLLRRFLEDVLGLDGETAGRDACRVEHDVSGETVRRLARFVEFIEACPRCGPDWVSRFQCYAEGGIGGDPADCAEACASDWGGRLSGHERGLCTGEPADAENGAGRDV